MVFETPSNRLQAVICHTQIKPPHLTTGLSAWFRILHWTWTIWYSFAFGEIWSAFFMFQSCRWKTFTIIYVEFLFRWIICRHSIFARNEVNLVLTFWAFIRNSYNLENIGMSGFGSVMKRLSNKSGWTNRHSFEKATTLPHSFSNPKEFYYIA